MQQDPLITGGNVEHVADLLGAAAGDVAHRDHRALRIRELLHLTLRDIQGLPAEERILGQGAPVPRIAVPMAGERGARRTEAIRLDRSLPFVPSEEKGTERASRGPRPIAVFTRIFRIQVRNEERPSKRSRPFTTPSHASCATSSATARVLT